jgi:hypothetical protein
MAAKIVRDLKSLPDTTTPIPGAKPPVTSFPVYDDPPSEEEVDDFLSFIRELRRGKPSRRKPPR